MGQNALAVIEDYEGVAAQLRGHTAEEQATACRALGAQLLEALSRVSDFEKLAVWLVDKLYRSLNDVEMADGASFAVLRTIGGAFREASRARGTSVAYLVDNGLPDDRLRLLDAAFNALGFVVASPEVLARRLAEADGIPADAELAAFFARYEVEAKVVASRLFAETVAQGGHVAWLSGAADAQDLGRLAATLEGTPFVGIFRNDAPVDGTTVQIFRAAGTSSPLDFG